MKMSYNLKSNEQARKVIKKLKRIEKRMDIRFKQITYVYKKGKR